MVDTKTVEKVLETISASPANRDYFFANLHSSEWIVPLRDVGLFKKPIAALRDDRGIAFLPWPESTYLARMAGEEPELVRDIILDTAETDNERVHQDFVEAALKMPPDVARDVAKFEASWIRKQRYLYLLYPEKVGELISFLAKSRQLDVALLLAREVLMIVPPAEKKEEAEEKAEFSFPPDPQAKCRQWEYQRVLSDHIPDLAKAAPERTIRLLSDLLEAALRIRVRGRPNEVEDYSWIWRPSVESRHLDGYAEDLVSAIRDVAVEMSTSPEKTRQAIQLLQGRKWRIFRRLAAHVLNASRAASVEILEDTLTGDIEYADFPSNSPEFGKLLRSRFAALGEGAKNKILSIIERGPDVGPFKKRRDAEGRPATQQEIDNLSDSWRHKWLYFIKADLPTPWRQRYEEFAQRFREPADEDGTRHAGAFVGPNSPRTAEQLREMSADELIGLLQNWHSTGEWNAPSPEGLGRALSEMLAKQPSKLANDAKLLEGLDPTYVRSAIDGFTNAVKKKQYFNWGPVLELCEWAVAQGNDSKPAEVRPEESDPDWNWARKSIGWFLKEALNVEGEKAIHSDQRTRIWKIIRLLAGDASPEEREFHSSMFGGISLNVTRGVALDAMFHYARWLHRHIDAPPNAKRTLALIPELELALDDHLTNDKSLAAREVFGRNFPLLHWLDDSYAALAAPRIFGEEDRALGDIAFSNYLLFCPPYTQVLPLLVKYYLRAIGQIGVEFRKDVDDIDRHLAQHVVSFYWRGNVDIDSDDALVRTFFSEAPSRLRSHAVEFIGRSLHGAEPIPSEVRERLIKIWEWRWAELRQHKCDGEPVPFGIWFASGQFNLDWSLENLLSVLRHCHKAELDFWVVDRLAAVVSERPTATVRALGMMIEGDREGWALHGWGDHPRTILSTALNSEIQDARREAERVIHLLGSRGWYGFRDLLRQP